MPKICYDCLQNLDISLRYSLLTSEKRRKGLVEEGHMGPLALCHHDAQRRSSSSSTTSSSWLAWPNLVYTVQTLSLKSVKYTGSLAPEDFSGAVFNHSYFE